jgi:diguanylate cyclase (GGDEF)-like protein
MPLTSHTKTVRKKLYGLLAFYVLSIFILAVAWEFYLEGAAMELLGLPYDGDFELAERWRFVLTSSGFGVLAMIVPFVLLQRLLKQLRQSYDDLMEARAQSDSLARHDPLSGLLNRRVFNEQLATRLAVPDNQTAVFLIDLDNFKLINDTHGHAAGDSAICAAADRLREVASGWQASLARLGGDEFALAVSGDFNRAELATLATTLLSTMAAPLAGYPTVNLSATVGIAVAPMDATQVQILLQQADCAMYRGKNGGRAVFHFYEASFEREQREQARFDEALREAVVAGDIQPFYQPLVSLPDQALVGFEILARWQHPERGLVMPLEFIPVAERLGLIQELTAGLLRQAFAQARQWPGALNLSINVTASMIENPDFPQWLERLAREGAFPLNRLEVEVTENTLVANVASAQVNLQCLRTMGVSVALDDFGTGYSGLYHLTQLAIDKIKIDRSFLDSTLDNQNEMVRAILALGKSLRMQITAEGVEHERLAHWLADNGCDFAQGYLFGRPLPPGRVMDVLACQQALQEHSPLRAGGLG